MSIWVLILILILMAWTFHKQSSAELSYAARIVANLYWIRMQSGKTNKWVKMVGKLYQVQMKTAPFWHCYHVRNMKKICTISTNKCYSEKGWCWNTKMPAPVRLDSGQYGVYLLCHHQQFPENCNYDGIMWVCFVVVTSMGARFVFHGPSLM